MAEASPFGAILAGGKSRRFGSPKALAILGGETILSRVLRAHIAAELSAFIVADGPGKFAEYGAPIVVDLWPGTGPLGGLHAALSHVAAMGGEGVCATGCDLPFLEAGMLRTLLERRNGHDAVILLDERAPSHRPLIGWYSTRTLPIVEEAIQSRDLALHRLIDRLPSPLLLSIGELPLLHPPEVAFMNVNTREDLQVALEHLHHHPDS